MYLEMVEKQHCWSLSWGSTGMLSGAFQAFHFNRFIAPRTLFSFFLSSDRCKRSWFRAHNCHFRVRVLFQVVLEFSSQLTTFHGHSWTDSLHLFTWRVLESLLTLISSITDAWTSQEASLSGQKPKPESFPFFWAPTRALTCLTIAHQGGDTALFSLRSHLPRPQKTWCFDKKSVD